MLRKWFALAALALLAGCGAMKPEEFAGKTPVLKLEEYFQGRTRAWGLFQDRFGKVRRQFVVEIEGKWDGKVLTLVEDFTYDDGETERRVWELTRLDEHRWEGRTPDAIGVAEGTLYGPAFRFRYDFNLKVGDGRMRVHFDDWMFLQPGGTVLNRATMSKFGIDLGEVIIAFRPAGEEMPTQKAAE
ncbi:MAG TPA: DUF3833 domain-containing protein [Azospirillaceae bacterium]|nr:DUF3833 domain-containing protein [Azospirillaceae bacterium]